MTQKDGIADNPDKARAGAESAPQASSSDPNAEAEGRQCERSRLGRSGWRTGVGLYVLVFGVVGAATAVRWALGPLFGEGKPFIAFYPAIVVAALVGGPRAGLFATVLSALTVDLLFVQPRGTWIPVKLSDWVAMGLFLTGGGLISWMAGSVDRVRRQEVEARERKRAEAWLRADLAAVTRMHELSRKVLESEDHQGLLQELVNAAVEIVGADQGALQLLEGDTLRIVAHQGHQPPFLKFFESAEKVASACGKAAKDARRVVVSDVEESELFAGTESLRVLRAAGVRSVQSTPIVSRSGKLLGVLSTHWKNVRRPDEHDLRRLDLLVRQAAELFEVARAEEALRSSERLHRAIGESIDYGIWICDPQGRNTYASESFLKLVGLTQQQCSEFGWGQVLHPEEAEATIAAWKQCVKSGGSWYREHRYRGVDGLWHPVLACGVPVRDERGQINCWAGINLDISRLKQAQGALRASESTLRSFYESASVMMGVVEVPPDNSDIIHIYQNPATDRFFGRVLGSSNGQSALAMGAPQEAVRHWIEQYRMAEREGRPVEFEYWHRKESGPVWLSVVVAKIGAGDSGRTQFSYVVADLTERREAVEALRASEERLRLATLGGDLAVWDWDTAHDTAYVSGKYYEMTGYHEGEVRVNLEFFRSLVHPEDWPTVESTMNSHLRGESDYWVTEYRMRKKSGEYRWIRGVGKVVARDEKGAPIRMAGVVADITAQKELTARKQAEEQARESERQFLLIANSAPVLIWTSGPDKLCTFFNASWLEFTGRTMEQEVGNGWVEGVHPEDLTHCLKIYNESFDARRAFTMEYRLRRHDGQYRWISDHGVPRYDTGEAFLGYIGSCVDLTERKEAEAEAQRSRDELAHVSRLSTLGALAGSIAHELNQPLASIVFNAKAAQRLMEGEWSNAHEVREALNDIAEQGLRAGEVIAGMRSMLQKDTGQMAVQDVNQLVTKVLEMLHSDLLTRRVRLALRLDPLLPKVNGHGVQLRQVVLNLVMNACEAMSQEPVGQRRLTIESRRVADNQVEVSVADTGPGFPKKMLQNPFEPFQTTKVKGLGLGLTICSTIITAHGGSLVPANNADKGATIRFTLPARTG